MVEKNTVNLKTLHARYRLGDEPTPEKMFDAVQNHIKKTACQSSVSTTSTNNWGGPELMAAVLYFCEPIFVIDVALEGVVHVQMYTIESIDSFDLSTPKSVKIRQLDPGRAHCLLQTYLNHEVIPLILSLRHGVDGAGGHFMPIRFEAPRYRKWCVVDDARPPM